MRVLSLPTLADIELGAVYRPSFSLKQHLDINTGDRFMYETEGVKVRCEMVDRERFKVIEKLPPSNKSFVKRGTKI
jgi:hypothetical protein